MVRTVVGLGVVALVLSAAGPASGSEGFSSDRAMRHVRELSEAIGPRKTGTQGERAARDYVAEQMKQLGLEVRRQPVPRLGTALVGSENIVGVLKGKLPDTILIGSHHDSRATDVPGANDDASAVGVMLEAARVLAADRPVATVVFVSFCAEEEGLLGARHFAETQDLSSLRVVINMDPVGQREIFISPFPVAPPLWANRALARAAGGGRISGVIYDPLYLLVTRSIEIPFGADHEPFRDKAVPAFSISDRFRVWTYHTREDRAEWIEPHTLESAGLAVLGLVRLFDEKPPTADSGPGDSTYVIVTVAGRPLFIVTPALYVLACTVVILAALWWRRIGWKAARRGRRLTRVDALRALARAGIPLAGAILGALSSEALSQAITGYRFSWWSHQGAHVAQAGAFALVGLAIGWRIAARFQQPEEAETYMVLSAGLASILGFMPMAIGRPDIAFYFLLPAATTIGAAIIRPGMAGAGTLLGSLPLLTLVTPSNYADAVAFVDLSPPPWISGPALLMVGLPLALGLARSLSAPAPTRPMRYVVVAGALAGFTLLVSNAASGSYDRLHRRVIRVHEMVDLNGSVESRATMRLNSAEYLRGVRTNLPGMAVIDRRATELTATVQLPDALREGMAPAVTLERPEAEDDSVRDLRVVSFPPGTVDRARIILRSAESLRMLDDGVWITKSEFIRRHVYADDSPSDTFRLSGRAGQTVEVEIRLEMAGDVLGVQLSADDAVIQWSAALDWRGSVTF